MLDPLFFRVIAAVFFLLLVAAGIHKLSDRLRFKGILAAYEILPVHLVAAVSLLIPVFEIMLGLGWLFGWQIDFVSVATVGLLTAYAMAMGINLARGRTYIDCGCGFSSAKAKKDESGIQQLSKWLVYRNVVLILLALVAGAGEAPRSFGMLDYFSFIAAIVALIFVYSAFHQLLVNHNAIDSWRKPLLIKTATGNHHD